jgi:hypothetical protein
MSVYTGELTPKVVIKCMATIKGAFPQLPMEYFQILSDRFRENGFGDDRLQDAVKHVVDNCVYPTPTIANFIGYDKKVQLYNYHEMLDMVHKLGAGVWENYEVMEVKGKRFWYSKADELTR